MCIVWWNSPREYQADDGQSTNITHTNAKRGTGDGRYTAPPPSRARTPACPQSPTSRVAYSNNETWLLAQIDTRDEQRASTNPKRTQKQITN